MAIQTINIGNQVNDGLGDDLRTAFQKVNANFTALEASLIVTASNAAGVSGQGVVANGTGSNLTFKNLLAGDKITLTGFSDSIRIDCDQPDAFTRIETNEGYVIAEEYENITIQGGINIEVSASGRVITVDTVRDFENLLTTLDFGFVNTTFANTLQFAVSNLNIDLGTITSPGDLYIDLGSI